MCAMIEKLRMYCGSGMGRRVNNTNRWGCHPDPWKFEVRIPDREFKLDGRPPAGFPIPSSGFTVRTSSRPPLVPALQADPLSESQVRDDHDHEHDRGHQPGGE